MAISKHLQEQLDKLPRGRWFTKDEVILIPRTGWVLGSLVNAELLEKDWIDDEAKYRVVENT